MSCPRSHGEQASNRIETKTPLCLWLHHTSWILFILQTVGSQMKAWEHCVNSCPYKVGHKGKGLDGSQIQMKGSWSKEQIAKDPRYLKVVTQTAQFFFYCIHWLVQQNHLVKLTHTGEAQTYSNRLFCNHFVLVPITQAMHMQWTCFPICLAK